MSRCPTSFYWMELSVWPPTTLSATFPSRSSVDVKQDSKLGLNIRKIKQFRPVKVFQSTKRHGSGIDGLIILVTFHNPGALVLMKVSPGRNKPSNVQ